MTRFLPARAVAVILTAGVIAATLLAGPASAANTGGITFDLTSVQVADHAIRSGGCHSVPITATHSAPPQVDEVTATFEVWHGSEYIGSTYLTDARPGVLTGSFYYCSYQGVGSFRAGPAEVDWSSSTGDEFLSGEFVSSAQASFAVKQASAMAKPKWSKKGKVATITAKGKWFSVDASKWRKDPKGAVASLQRRVSSSAPWRVVKTDRADRKGVVVFTMKPKKRMQYRVVSRATKNSFEGVSPTITKR